jgi:two-component system response regulator FixJ
MPLMNGEDLVASLRMQHVQIPVLVITGYGEMDLVVRLMRLGCKDFLEKPFEPSVLRDSVKKILAEAAAKN